MDAITQVVVNDASCLIDLRKGGLLHVLCKLPYRFVVPLPIRNSELLNFSDEHWRVMESGGMVTYDLTADEVTAAFAAKTKNPALSANDCFCLVTAQVNDAVLLTGDARLASTARKSGMRVHGVLWVIDQLKEGSVCDDSLLADALTKWRLDATVFLPDDEILGRLSLLLPHGNLSRSKDGAPWEVRDEDPGGAPEYGEARNQDKSHSCGWLP